jgi:protein-tyrosine phosphatase
VHLSTAVKFIEDCREDGGIVLVHCAAGVSRSATVVAAWLMVSKKMSHKEALSFLAARRKVICPNPGFVKQLELFELELAK